MAKSVKVDIGGKEYSLTGDDEKLIKATAERVNEQFKNLIENHGNLPERTLSVLAALNIAEEDIKKEDDYLEFVNYLNKEVKQMSDMLKEAVS